MASRFTTKLVEDSNLKGLEKITIKPYLNFPALRRNSFNFKKSKFSHLQVLLKQRFNTKLGKEEVGTF